MESIEIALGSNLSTFECSIPGFEDRLQNISLHNCNYSNISMLASNQRNKILNLEILSNFREKRISFVQGTARNVSNILSR